MNCLIRPRRQWGHKTKAEANLPARVTVRLSKARTKSKQNKKKMAGCFT